MATKRTSKAARKSTSPPRQSPQRAGTESRRTRTPSGPPRLQSLSPCLWFDSEAEEAARFYVSIFPKAKILGITRYPAVGQEIHGREAGSVMTVEFLLNGLPFTALNGGPRFRFNEAISFQVICRTQAQIDYYWEKLGEGGDPQARQCGWLKDRFGLSWQVVPEGMGRVLKDAKSKSGARAFAAVMQMEKLDIAALEAAAAG
jgi:predicted 3-demethylubiquinone-9 3-methyltransferase (glyoxalase superfamily)